MEILTGALAGAVECLVVQPFDLVKTRYQLNPGMNAGIFSTLAGLVREGGVLRLYRGLLPEVAGGMPRSSAMYAGYTFAHRELLRLNSNQSTAGVALAAGCLAGVPEAVVATPFQVVKVRLQSREHLGRYKHTMDCLMKVCAEEGVGALTKGLATTCWRNAVWNGAYFSSMHVMKERQLEASATMGLGQALDSLVIGFMGGAIATSFNAPLDVAKSRIQSQRQAVESTTTLLKYRGTLHTLLTIGREEGFRALYKGYLPKLLRMGVGGAVGITSFDFFNSLASS